MSTFIYVALKKRKKQITEFNQLFFFIASSHFYNIQQQLEKVILQNLISCPEWLGVKTDYWVHDHTNMPYHANNKCVTFGAVCINLTLHKQQRSISPFKTVQNVHRGNSMRAFAMRGSFVFHYQHFHINFV